MQTKYRNSGFSLVELMIVVAILGILAAIAIPQYRGYIETSKRQIALTVLEQFPALLEGYRADHGILCPDCENTGSHDYTCTVAANKKKCEGTLVDAYPDFRSSNKSSAASPYDYTLTVTVANDFTTSATFTAIRNDEGEKQGYPDTMPDGSAIEGKYSE